MIKFSNFSLRRGQKLLFHDVNITIHRQQKVALVGTNGCGKTSLLAAIMNDLHADIGDLMLSQQQLIAYVKQETPALETSALEYVKSGDLAWLKISDNIRQAEKTHNENLLVHYYEQMDAINGFQMDVKAAQLLSGLGFSIEEHNKLVKHFSGGWRMRLNLAQALICHSDILLLDEPTNHLDLETVIWLEQWLNKYQGTLLLISHDRDFIDNICTHVLHIENQMIDIYSGNYSDFEKAYYEKQMLKQSQLIKQQAQIDHLTQFINRFRAKATKAKQVQSRIKALEKMEKISLRQTENPFKFSFFQIRKVPNPLLKLEKIQLAYDKQIIIDNINLVIAPGQRIALLGHNGAGKSSLLKCMIGELKPKSGDLFIHPELKIAYFAQHQLEQLNLQQTPFDFIQNLDKKASEQTVRNFLGSFGFHSSSENNKADSLIAPFSGGEKARLVLSSLVYQQPSLLVLDEPTNHLDMDMRDALAYALQDYQGALILVSHDRYLLNSVTDEFYLLENQKATPFDGTIEDYWSYLLKSKVNNVQISSENTSSKKLQRQKSALNRQKIKPLKTQLTKIEKEIENLTRQLSDIENKLNQSEIYQVDKKSELTDSLKLQGQIKNSLEIKEETWLELSEQIESELSDIKTGIV